MSSTILVPADSRALRGAERTSLTARLRQIEVQRGAFRNVTEASLKEEIENQTGNKPLPHDETLSSDDEEDSQKQNQKKVWSATQTMLRQLDRAKNDTLHALDFISLLLSKTSASAQSSMSPFLQQNVPIGTLEGRVLQKAMPSATVTKRLDQACRGWKANSFQASHDRMSLAADRLQAEAAKEASFWEQVARIRVSGWVLSRLPRDSRAIGVHFGFPESAPRFRSRGFALLRQDKTGDVYLDRAKMTEHDRYIRIHAIRDGLQTGQSSARQLIHKEDELQVLGQLQNARDDLFEEELFYEAAREARSIVNQGTNLTSNCITLKIDQSLKLEITLSSEHENDMLETTTADDSNLANCCAIGLRSLLAAAHQQNYRRRTEAPQPMSTHMKPKPEYVLLRPIITHLRHQNFTEDLRNSLRQFCQTFSQAGLPFTTSTSHPQVASVTLQEYTLGTPEIKIEMSLPTMREVEITGRTRTGPPIFGHTVHISAISYGEEQFRSEPADSASQCSDSLCDIMVADISTYIVDWYQNPKNNPNIDAATLNVKARLQDGQLMLEKNDQPVALIAVNVDSSRLGLRVRLRRPLDKRRDLRYTWTVDGISSSQDDGMSDENQPRRLDDVLALLLTHVREDAGD